MGFDVAIVGGGVAGLQLGAMLSYDGARVLVLEKTKTLGGRAQILERDGFLFDYGIHLVRFGPKSAIAEVMKHIKRPVSFHDIGTSYVLDEDGKVRVFPTKPITFLKTKMFGIRDLISLFGLLRGANPPKDMSVEDWISGVKGGARRYIQLVSGSMLVCPDVSRASAGELMNNVRKVLERRVSVMYPEGGWRYLFECWTETIKVRGEISPGTPVQKVIIKNGKAKGVITKGGEIEADKVVIAFPLQQLFKVVDERLFSRDFVKLCKSLRPTAGVSIDYALKKKVSDSIGLWYIFKPMVFGIFTSNLELSLAPRGKQILTFFYPTPIEDMLVKETAKQREKELEEAVRKLFPKLEVEWRRAMHLKMVDGIELNTKQFKEMRPGFKSDVENLFFVGDTTAADGAGGDVAHESVLECYKEISRSL